jgi:hypothetical protein
MTKHLNSEDSAPENPEALIYFTDFFGVDPQVLEKYGAFNISLINDLPLFIDPFLLFDSDKPEYNTLHDEIIQYVKFLRDVSVDTTISGGHVGQWFLFPEGLCPKSRFCGSFVIGFML